MSVLAHKVAVRYAGEGMIEFEVSPPPGGGDPVQVQVAHFAYGATVDTVVGPTVTLDYLAARKAVALMERHQVRDYVDIASLVDAGYGIGALLEMAFRGGTVPRGRGRRGRRRPRRRPRRLRRSRPGEPGPPMRTRGQPTATAATPMNRP